MDVPVLAIGASAGGVEALVHLVADLPADLAACVLVTVHTPARGHSALPKVLNRSGALPAEHVREGTKLRAGVVFVAPPDRHLLVVDGLVRPGDGPKINRHRPAVDPMFASAARWVGSATTAVVLSGALDDGAVGAALVAAAGGAVIVQDPAEAAFGGMPRAVVAAVPDAVVVPLAGMATTVIESVAAASGRAKPPSRERGGETVTMAESGDPASLAPGETSLTRLTCPDCRGSLARVDLDRISYYRCHVGHQWSAQSLAAAQADEVERELWAAVAVLEEQAALNRRLASSQRSSGDRRAATRPAVGKSYEATARHAAELADSLRTHLHAGQPAAADLIEQAGSG